MVCIYLIAFFHPSYCWTLSQRAQVFTAVFPAVIQQPFSGYSFFFSSSSHSSWGFQSTITSLLRGFRLVFYAMIKKKKVRYLNPHSLSLAQASICMARSDDIIPLCSLSQHAAFPVLLAFKFQLHIQHGTELFGSHLIAVYRHSRLFSSGTESASACFLNDT